MNGRTWVDRGKTSERISKAEAALAKLGYSRDGKSGRPQIVFGLVCDEWDCPIAVEVFEGNTADPKTVRAQVLKLRERFGLERVVMVGDRECSPARGSPKTWRRRGWTGSAHCVRRRG